MRKILSAVAACSMGIVLMAAPAAHAGTQDFVKTGVILLPAPEEAVIGPISFILLYGCNENSVFQGLDVLWVKLPAGSAGLPATATASNSIVNDVNVHFGTTPCHGIYDDSLSRTMGDESGTVPPRATWAAITLFRGANATITFTIKGALP